MNQLSSFFNFCGNFVHLRQISSRRNGDFAVKFIWACAFLFVYSLAGEIFLLKIVETDLTNSR